MHNKYEYRLRRAWETQKNGFMEQVILDRDDLALYVASAEFRAKEEGKLSCADYTKENLVHYLNDHSSNKIACPTLYENEQGIKFNWEKNWITNFFNKFYEKNLKSDQTHVIEKMIENQVWNEDKYLPDYQYAIANTIQDYKDMLKEPALCLGESAYRHVVYEQVMNNLDKNQKNCDYYKLFRKSFIDTMNEKFGIDEKLTEISLEKKSELWRPQVMLDTYKKVVEQKGLRNYVADKYKEALLKKFEYEYYQDNKKIIDELGVATNNMKLNIKQAERLNATIEKYEQKAIKNKENYIKSSSKNFGISVFKKKHINTINANNGLKEMTNQKNNDNGRTM